MSDGAAIHDTVLMFSKSWGALYLFVVFAGAVIWVYWPSRRKEMDRAARRPLEDEEKPWR